jgi:hypothetical protein
MLHPSSLIPHIFTGEQMNDTNSFWDVSQKLSLRLLLWGVLSMVVGGVLYRQSGLRRGMGAQFFGWGLIDALLALFGLFNLPRQRAIPPAAQPAAQAQERQKLRRILWVNTVLDVFYVAGGVWFWQKHGRDNPEKQGHALGVIIQGGFLFFFDLWHALKL